MARQRHTPEQVINKLREAEVAIAGRNKARWATGRRHLMPSYLPTLSPCLSD